MRLAECLLVAAALVVVPRLAFAETCESGSKMKDGKCMPWDCNQASECGPNMVCKPAQLCIRGTSDEPIDASVPGEVAQACSHGTCPPGSRCSTANRCLSFADAERMKVVPPQVASVVNPQIDYSPKASASATPVPAEKEKKKSGCGCEAVGAGQSSNAVALGGLGLVGALVIGRRRRRRG
jgi:MYXO-CTERM domain-containing protein